jgi:vitellogenic carboxypeptidase-like protein
LATCALPLQAYRVWDAFLNGDTTIGGAWFTNVTGLSNYFNIASDPGQAFNYFEAWVTSPAVRAAIGVGSQPYADGNVAVEVALTADVMYSQRQRVEALLQSTQPRYKVLIYNGALDLICGAPLTERYVSVMDWPGAPSFSAARRSVWLDPQFSDGTVSGYVRAAESADAGILMQAVMRGAGHMAPFDQPSRALDLITRFVDGTGF